jgi:RNA polymerase sigma-70 factor (sigma-E family)
VKVTTAGRVTDEARGPGSALSVGVSISARRLPKPVIALAGPPGSFDEFLAARGNWVYRICFLLAGDPHATNDLSQNVLIQIYREWDRVREAHDIDAYVRRIIINEHRRTWRRQSAHEQPIGNLDQLLDAGRSSVDFTNSLVTRESLASSLAKLTERERTVIVLRYYQDLDDHAIADLIGSRYATVRSIARRAIEKLRDDITIKPQKKELN